MGPFFYERLGLRLEVDEPVADLAFGADIHVSAELDDAPRDLLRARLCACRPAPRLAQCLVRNGFLLRRACEDLAQDGEPRVLRVDALFESDSSERPER